MKNKQKQISKKIKEKKERKFQTLEENLTEKKGVKKAISLMLKGKKKEAVEMFSEFNREEIYDLFMTAEKMYSKEHRTEREKRIAKAILSIAEEAGKRYKEIDKETQEIMIESSGEMKIPDFLSLVSHGLRIKNLYNFAEKAVRDRNAGMLEFLYENASESIDWFNNYSNSLLEKEVKNSKINKRIINLFVKKIKFNPFVLNLLPSTLYFSIVHDRIMEMLEENEKTWGKALGEALKTGSVKEGMKIFESYELISKENREHLKEFLDSLINFEDVVEKFKRGKDIDKNAHYFFRIYYALSIEKCLAKAKNELRKKKKALDDLINYTKTRKSNAKIEDIVEQLKNKKIASALKMIGDGSTLKQKQKEGTILHLIVDNGLYQYIELLADYFKKEVPWYGKNRSGYNFFEYILFSIEGHMSKEELKKIIEMLDSILEKTMLNPFVGGKLSEKARKEEIREFVIDYEKRWLKILYSKEVRENVEKLGHIAKIGTTLFLSETCSEMLLEFIK